MADFGSAASYSRESGQPYRNDWNSLNATGEQLAIVQELMAGAELLPAQLPSFSNWSPEKKLAATVLAAALVEIRDRAGQRRFAREVEETRAWVFSDDTEWPFSFLPLCTLLALEPDWVRETVRGWINTPEGKRPSCYRAAA
jgi:hypothetical protein